MRHESDPRLVQRFKTFSAAASLFSMAVGLSALAGWIFHIAILKSWIPGQVSVRVNAAICFVLLGFALWVLRKSAGESQGRGLRLAARAAGTVAAVVGSISLLENLTGWSLGLDQILHTIRAGEEIGSVRPGLVPLIASLSISLLGISLLILNWKTKRGDWPAQFPAGAAGLCATFGILDFVVGHDVSHTHVALPGALSLLILSLGVICARPEWAIGGLLASRSLGAQWLRRAGPCALVALVFFAGLLSRPVLTTEHLSWIEWTILAVSAGVALTALIGWTALVLDRSDRQRRTAEEALGAPADEIDRLMDRYDESAVEAGLRRWSVAGIVIGVLVAVLGGIGSWQNLRRAAESDDWVAHTHAVNAALEGALSDVVEVESGARGFAATGGEVFLDAFDSGRRRLPDDLKALNALTIDNPSQQERLQRLRPELEARVAQAEATIDERRQTGRVPSSSLFLGGKQKMDAVRATLGEMQAEEARLLERRIANAAEMRQRTITATALTTLAGVCMLLFAGMVTRREIKRSAKMRGEILALNSDLERRVTERTAKLQESEQTLRLFIDHAPAALAMFDREMRYVQASDRWRRDYGLDDRELTGVSHYELFPQIPEEWKEIHRRALAGEVLAADHDQFQRADGATQWIRWEVRPWHNVGGDIGGIVIFAEDVTEQERAEQALRESHARLKKVLEVETVGVLFWDLTTGRLVDANDAFLKLMGYSRSDVETGGLSWQKLTPPEYVEMSLAEVRKFAESGRVGPYEKEYFRKDGTRQWLLFAGSSLGGNSCVEFCVDVSHRKLAEAALRESERRVRTLMDSTAEAIIGDDLQGNCTFCNPAALRLLGYEDQAELLGKNLHTLLHHSHPDGSPLSSEDCPVSKAIQQGQAFHSVEIVFWRKDGSAFPIECWSHPLSDDGKATGAVMTFLDISERKQAGEASRRLAAIFTCSNDGIIGKTLDGIVTSWNPGAEAVYGYSAAEMIGCSLTRIVPPDRLGEFHRMLEQIRGGETIKHFETVRLHRDGRLIDSSISVSPLRDTMGNLIGASTIARDISAQKAAEREIRRLNEDLERRVEQRTEQLQAANMELEAFTYSVSHDLRAPLRHISGFSKMLVEEFGASLPAGAQHYVQRICDSVLRMGILVDDLLNLGRVSRKELQLQTTSLRTLVDEVTSELQPDCTNRQIEWKVGTLPFVDGDPGLLKQVLQNLLLNALKFTRTRATAVIEVGQREENGVAAIYVRDNGVGFSMKYADKLFGVFQRLHRQEDFEGTGVGLATVQRIIQKHGGRIWAEAELDKGATFYFTLASSNGEASFGKSASAGGNS